MSSFRWQKLKAALVERRSKLGESQNIQQVTRDAEDIEAWISEKLQSVQDESYMDPSNLQVNAWGRLYKIRNYYLTAQKVVK